ncbi:MAG: hypothetical protein AB6733_15040 [Clostridiaceae bacterium]
MFYLYTLVLLFITLVVCFSFKYCIKAPKKIKVLSMVAFTILLLRYITLLILFYSSRITYLYNFKYSFFMQLCGIPILILIVLYITIRNTKINFNYIYLLAIIFFAIYLGVVVRNEISLGIFVDYKFGYFMSFTNQYILVYYGAINIFALIFTLSLLYETRDKIAIFISSLAALVSTIEVVANLMGIMLMPQYIFGELLWIVSMVYLVIKISKK